MKVRSKAVIACSALLATVPMCLAQTAESAPKPSPYVGVSQPPPDDTIVSTPDTPPPAVHVVEPAPQRAPALVKRPVDPDAGIVTHPVSGYETTRPGTDRYAGNDKYAGTANYSSNERYSSTAAYRSSNPDANIVTSVPTRSGELPEGTNIHIRLAQQLSSTATRAGTPFSGQVAKDVTLQGRVVIPQGSELRGKVTSVSEGHRFRNRATIRLRPDAIVLPDGSQYSLHAALISAHNHNLKVDNEGGATTKSQVKKDAVEEGIGAGAGAIAGAGIGGGAGAVVGTLVGVGVVTTHLIVQRPQIVDLAPNTTIVFSLTEPLALTPIQN